MDEALTARHMKTGFVQLVHDYVGNTQTILYYLGEKVWCTVFGCSEVALRFPSAVFGTLTVWAIFLLARQIFSQSAALWSALLLAINPFAIYYSQEARPYALFLLAAVFSLCFLYEYLRSPGRGAAWGYVISASVALWVHPLGPLLLPVHGAMVAFFHPNADGRHLQRTVGLMVAVSVLYLPQLALMWKAVADTARGLGSASWIRLPGLRDITGMWRQYFMSPYLAGFALLILVAAVFAYRARTDRRGLYLCAMLFFAFVPLLWIVSHVVAPLYVPRFTIPALAAVLMVLGWSAASMRLRWRVAVLSIYLLLTAQALSAYYTKTDKDPWRRTALVVREETRPGDAIVINASYARAAFDYYFALSHEVNVIAPWSVGEISAALNTAPRVIFVRAYPFTHHEITDSLYARSARGRKIGSTVNINDLAPQNPWVYWIADISVTRYDQDP